MSIRRHLNILLALLAGAGASRSGFAGAGSEELSFEKLETGTAPDPRFDHALAVDRKGKRLFLFGGRDATRYFNDLWVFDAAKRSWSRVPAEGGPQARSGHSLAWDQSSERLILFGGYRGDKFGQTNFFRELWFYSADAGWSREFFKAGPAGRAWHAVSVIDGFMYLYGGFAGAPEYHLTDVWALDLQNISWIRKATDGGPDMAGRPALLPLGDATKQLVFGRLGVTRPESAGLWLLDVGSDSWSQPDTGGAPPVDFMLCAANSWEESILVIRAPEEGDTDWELWKYSGDENDWSRTRVNEGPPVTHGLVCAPDPALPAGWICFGGVKRQWVTGETWLVITSSLPPEGGLVGK